MELLCCSSIFAVFIFLEVPVSLFVILKGLHDSFLIGYFEMMTTYSSQGNRKSNQ